MQQLKRDILQSPKDNLIDLLTDGDRIVEEFSVVPYDYTIDDWSTPTLFLTQNRLIFVYDETIEIYTLANIELDIYGDPPKFTPWQQWFEGSYYYSKDKRESFQALKVADFYTRLVITEAKQVPKEFALREGPVVGKTYQSWAMAQLIINKKHNVASDDRLKEMLLGRFTKFNNSTVTTFTLVFIGYFILSIFLGDLVEVIGTILDVVFGVLVILMGLWSYKSVEKNLSAFESVYNSYGHRLKQGQTPPPNPVKTV